MTPLPHPCPYLTLRSDPTKPKKTKKEKRRKEVKKKKKITFVD